MDTRIIQSWFRYIEPHLIHSEKVVILGFGLGQHICEFQKKYPQIELMIVDPRKENLVSQQKYIHSSFQYVNTLEGIIHLKKILNASTVPIPILNFRPCWNHYKTFFILAEKILVGMNDLKGWRNTSSHFILESLFV